MAVKWGVVSLVLCALGFHEVSHAIEVDLTIEINAGATECFWQRIKSKVSTELEYQVRKLIVSHVRTPIPLDNRFIWTLTVRLPTS